MVSRFGLLSSKRKGLYNLPTRVPSSGSVMSDTSKVTQETWLKLFNFLENVCKDGTWSIQSLFPGCNSGGSDSWFVCQKSGFPSVCRYVMAMETRLTFSPKVRFATCHPLSLCLWGWETSQVLFHRSSSLHRAHLATVLTRMCLHATFHPTSGK